MFRLFSIAAAYQAGQLLKFIYFIIIPILFNFKMLGEVAIIVSLCLISSGLIDFGSKYYFWKSSTRENLKASLRSKLQICFFASLVLLVIFILINIFAKLNFDYYQIVLILFCGVVGQGTFDWYFIVEDRVKHLLFSIVAFNICPIFLLLLGFLLKSQIIVLYSFPIGFIIVGTLHVLIMKPDILKIDKFPYLSDLLNHSFILPGQHIFIQAFIPILGLILDPKELGKIRFMTVGSGMAIALASYLVMASYKKENIKLSLNKRKWISILINFFIALLTISHIYFGRKLDFEIYKMEIFHISGFTLLALLLSIASYEQERSLFKDQKDRTFIILYGYPFFVAVFVALFFNYGLELNLNLSLNILLVSAFLILTFISLSPKSDLVKSLFYKPYHVILLVIQMSSIIYFSLYCS